MIILCSHESLVIDRWRDALSTTQNNILTVESEQSLRKQLNRSQGGEIVLLHTSLPMLDGLDGVRQLRSDYPGARFIIFSNSPEQKEGMEVLRAGAFGYANTYMHAEVITKAVELVALGEVWVGKDLMQQFIMGIPSSSNNMQTDDVARAAYNKLSDREKEVALLVAEGKSNKQIANLINVTERTVKAHLTSIFAKTGAKDRLKLAIQMRNMKQDEPDSQVG